MTSPPESRTSSTIFTYSFRFTKSGHLIGWKTKGKLLITPHPSTAIQLTLAATKRLICVYERNRTTASSSTFHIILFFLAAYLLLVSLNTKNRASVCHEVENKLLFSVILFAVHNGTRFLRVLRRVSAIKQDQVQLPIESPEGSPTEDTLKGRQEPDKRDHQSRR